MSDPVEDNNSVTTDPSESPNWTLLELPKLSNWKCYLFGSLPANPALVYTPSEGNVPNWFIRWMMRICLGCTWVETSPIVDNGEKRELVTIDPELSIYKPTSTEDSED